MDKKALIHLWMMLPSYFQVPLVNRLTQLKAALFREQVNKTLLYKSITNKLKEDRL